MFVNMFVKALKQEKRSTMVYYREKMVDRDVLCPINVMSFKFNQLQHRPDKSVNVLFFLLLDKPWSYITVDLIFYAPNVANHGF